MYLNIKIVVEKERRKPTSIPKLTRTRNTNIFVRSDNNPEVFSYIEPFNYENINKRSIKAVDFNRIKDREDLLTIKSPGPSVATYNPKYNLVFPVTLKSNTLIKETSNPMRKEFWKRRR